VSDAIYQRKIDGCPLIGGRRAVPADRLPELFRVLRERAVRQRMA
jgi:hypothetical protein